MKVKKPKTVSQLKKKVYYEKNKERLKERARLYYYENREKVRARTNIRSRADHARKRLDALEAIGEARCAKCGFDDPRALHIDHIEGGGRQHRLSFKGHYKAYYSFISENPVGFQILCANCNFIKVYENKEAYNVS